MERNTAKCVLGRWEAAQSLMQLTEEDIIELSKPEAQQTKETVALEPNIPVRSDG